MVRDALDFDKNNDEVTCKALFKLYTELVSRLPKREYKLVTSQDDLNFEADV